VNLESFAIFNRTSDQEDFVDLALEATEEINLNKGTSQLLTYIN